MTDGRHDYTFQRVLPGLGTSRFGVFLFGGPFDALRGSWLAQALPLESGPFDTPLRL
jgi:hypothetical protein